MARWGNWRLLVLLVALFMPVSAQASTPQGLVVSPAFQEVSVKAGQAQARYDLQLRNYTGTDQTFRLSVVDFGALDESGGVAFLGSPTSELEHRYGLASWMRLEKDAVVVPGGGSVAVIITIENRPSLAPGGHYGAVLATAVSDGIEPGKNPRVGVKQVLSSLVLATKEGGGERQLRLDSQTGNGSWWQLPSRVVHRFQNQGNLHVTPRGVITMRDALGRVVARGALNDGSNVILPESFRRYQTPLTNVAAAWLPGRYSLVTEYRYDGTDQVQILTTHIWYAGLLVSWIVIILGLGLVVAVVWWLRRHHKA